MISTKTQKLHLVSQQEVLKIKIHTQSEKKITLSNRVIASFF